MRLAAFLAVAAAELADIGSSLYAEAHGAIEGNPAFGSPAQMVVAKVVVVFVVAAALFGRPETVTTSLYDRLVTSVLFVCSGVLFEVALHNLQVIP